jgi:hypothetical protein
LNSITSHPIPAKADRPYPLATTFTKGDLLSYRGAARRLNTPQIFGDFAFLWFVQQATFSETNLHGLDSRLQELKGGLVTWVRYFMKKCPLIFPANIGAIQDVTRRIESYNFLYIIQRIQF